MVSEFEIPKSEDPKLDKYQLTRRKMVASAKESIEQKASNSEIYGNMRAVLIEMDSSPINTVIKELEDLKEAVMKEEDPKDTFDPEKHIDAYLPVRFYSDGAGQPE
ncbi:hypothetical protein OIU76_018381 [Salix suchowensis]|nr:hypothetical protein OIU76_018381 [Salix suchowensis]